MGLYGSIWVTRTTEGMQCVNQSSQMLQGQYSAGQTGLYLMDTKAQIGLAKMIGRTDAAVELQRRFELVAKTTVATLWNETEGVFQSKRPTTPPTSIEITIPNHFYPLLAGPEYGPSEAIATATVEKALTNPIKMAVWPSREMPANVPPEYTRPLVSWYSQKLQKGPRGEPAGFGNTSGPHVLCCQPECNFRYAFGDFVQRCHGKIVWYEGMALAKKLPAETLGLPAGSELVALYEYNCSVPGAAPDMALGPANWKPVHGGPCERLAPSTLEEGVAMYVMPTRAGPAAASLVELEVWYKPGDHYTVGSAKGRADALSKGYNKVESLGFVWPAPGTENATSRYGCPSVSKDNSNYAMQDYWRGRIWTPMLQLVAWGLEEYESPVVKGALAGLAQQSKAVLMRDWLGFESSDGYSGTGRRVYENYGADTAEGYSYSSSAFPMYAWGALAGFVGLRTEGFYAPLHNESMVALA